MTLLTLYDSTRLTSRQNRDWNLIEKIRNTSRTMTFFYILVSILFTIIVWQFDELEALVYPFTLLSTFFHEISHGIMAMLCFGFRSFEKLHISADGSGEAIYQIETLKNSELTAKYLEKHKEALIAVAGLIGPSLWGALLVIPAAFFPRPFEFFNKRIVFTVPRMLLFGLCCFIITCCILWIEGLFALIFMMLFCLLFGYVAFKCKPETAVFWTMFTGVQALISFFHGWEYIFVKFVEDLDDTQKKNPKPDSKKSFSDTGVIAESLGFSTEFVGSMVFLIDCGLLLFCLLVAYSRHYKQNIEQQEKDMPRPILPT